MAQSQIFAAFGKSLGNNKGSAQNFGIVGITITFQELSKFIFFYCPCDYPDNKLYGSVFIWGPGVILFIVGYLANRRTWRLTTGLCNRTQGIGKGGKRIFHFIFIFLQIGVKAIIAPATWIVLAFLKGDYYACSRWPNPNDLKARAHFGLDTTKNTSLPRPCMFNSNPLKFDSSEAEIIARNLRAESHVIGWMYLSIGMALGVIIMFMLKCKSKYSYEQSNYIERYRASEISMFEAELDKKAAEQAKRIVEGYFTKPRAKEEWDQIAVINDKVTRSKRGRAIYSPLHKFVNRELRAAEDADKQPPDLVSDAAMKKKSALAAAKKKPGAKKSTNGGGGGEGGAMIPMVPMVVGGGSKTTVLKTQNPVEMKTGNFQDNPNAKTTGVGKPAPSGEGHVVPNVQVVDPSAKPAASQGTAEEPKPPVTAPQALAEEPPAASTQVPVGKPEPPITTSQVPVEKPVPPVPTSEPAVVSAPPAIPPPPQPVRPAQPEPTAGPPEIQAAVKETSLGDFGGAVSRENLHRLDEDDDSDAVLPDGDDVIKSEADVDGGTEIAQEQAESDLVRHSDEEPLLGDD